MTFTKRQINDLETIEYFAPSSLQSIIPTDEDKIIFFEISEKGMHKDIKARGTAGYTNPKMTRGLAKLLEGKRWRGIHVHEMYEDGILEGSMPYAVILEGMPRSVVDFLKKEMFKGCDADVIERANAQVNDQK